MPSYPSIFRILLALLLSLPVGKVAFAFSSNAVPGRVYIKRQGCTKADRLQDERHQSLPDAILSVGGYVSSAASVQSIPKSPSNGFSAYCYQPLLASIHFRGSNKSGLLCWHLAASMVRDEQLRALYPAHAFW
jgi:hypothetical protein